MKRSVLWFILLLQINFAFSQTDSVDIFLKNEMLKRKIPGLQVAVIRSGKIVKSASYGFSNLQDSVPVNSKTIFTINSMTKAFTGVAIMQLVEAGKLDLSKSVADYLDSIPSSWRSITINHLLSHTSGIPQVNDPGEIYLSKLQNMPLDAKPGDEFSYNQMNYFLLGRIIDKLSGIPFAQFIKDRQLNKANMTQTCLGDFYDIIPHSVRGYSYLKTGNLTNVFEEFLPPFRTSAGMNSTAEEIAQWSIALQNGKLIKKENLSILWKPAILNNGTHKGFSDLLNGYALGWLTVIRPKHPAIAAVGGARSALFIYPNDNLSIVILTNLQGAWPETFIDEVARFYLK